MTASVGIGVVSHNTAALLEQCLDAATRDSAHVVVVDTRSTDGSTELVRRRFPGVRLLALERNVGFGAAVNRAVAELGTPFVLLLNADTVVAPGASEALADYLEERPNVAVAGPRLVGLDGVRQHSAHSFPAPLALLLQESGVSRVGRRLRRREPAAGPADWVTGAAFAIRRAAFDAVGGFDEGYFMYQEEVDFCHRLRGAGWDVHYAPVTTVVHHGGASTRQDEPAMMAQFARSTGRFARLRLGGRAPVLVRTVLASVFAGRIARDRIALSLARDGERRALLQHRLTVWRAGRQGLAGPDDRQVPALERPSRR